MVTLGDEVCSCSSSNPNKRPEFMITTRTCDQGAFNIAGVADNFYSGADGIDFNANLRISTIDFGTFHLYP